MENKNSLLGFSKKEDGIKVYKDKTIRYCILNNSRVGVLESYDNDYVYLLPTLVQESLYPNGKEKLEARIENKTPTRIRRVGEEIVEVLSDDYLERFVKTLKNGNSKDSLLIT